MRKILFTSILILLIAGISIVMIMCGCQKEKNCIATDKVLLAENDSVAILYQLVDSAKKEYDFPEYNILPEVAIWIKNKTTKQETKLYQTGQSLCSYMGDEKNRFYPLPIDSIPVTSRVTIYNDNPLQLIVEGYPDMLHISSYFIDVPTRKAWHVPANMGYVGSTSEEGYMIFQSKRYFSDPDIAGRYTFLQIFDNTGNMIDSLDLEHTRL